MVLVVVCEQYIWFIILWEMSLQLMTELWEYVLLYINGFETSNKDTADTATATALMMLTITVTFVASVVYEPLEQADEDVEVIRLTPTGLTANVNNSSVGNDNIFIAYRRADPLADCNVLTVADICIILANKVY